MAIVKRKSKDGFRYMVRVRDRYGKRYPAQTFERKVEAERFETQLKSKRNKGDLAQSEDIRKATYAEYFALWAQKMRSQISEGWRMSQDQMARDHILPVIGERKLLDLRPMDIQDVIDNCEVKGLGEQTILHVYNLMHKSFDDAVHIAELLERYCGEMILGRWEGGTSHLLTRRKARSTNKMTHTLKGPDYLRSLTA